MTNPFDGALRTAPNETWLDELARASMLAGRRIFYPEDELDRLRVTLKTDAVDAYKTGLVAQAVQSAVAKMGHYLREPQATPRRQSSDRRMTRLIPRASFGASMVFDLGTPVDQPVDETSPFDLNVQTLTQEAVVELLSILPDGEDDERALDAMASRQPGEQSAVRELSDAIATLKDGIELCLGDGESDAERSVITVPQAAQIRDQIAMTHTHIETLQLTGTLDGMRTSRRIFFLAFEDRADITGAVGQDLIQTVQQHVGLEVDVVLRKTIVEDRAGSRRRPSYELLELHRHEGLELDPSAGGKP